MLETPVRCICSRCPSDAYARDASGSLAQFDAHDPTTRILLNNYINMCAIKEKNIRNPPNAASAYVTYACASVNPSIIAYLSESVAESIDLPNVGNQ